jgi:hypothetical protein
MINLNFVFGSNLDKFFKLIKCLFKMTYFNVDGRLSRVFVKSHPIFKYVIEHCKLLMGLLNLFILSTLKLNLMEIILSYKF